MNNANPTVTSKEQMSALMDAELDIQECEFLIRKMNTDHGLQESWHRYHITRACMQKEFDGSTTLVARVRIALADVELDDEIKQQSNPTKRFGSPWLRTGFGGALAASVALVAIVGLNTRLGPSSDVDLLADQAPDFVSQSTPMDRQFNRQAVPVGLGNLPAAGQSQYFSPSQIAAQPFTEPRARINQYIIGNTQPAVNGVLPYAPISTVPAEQVEMIPLNPVSSDVQTTDPGGSPN